MTIHFIKDDYSNHELHFGKSITPVDVGIWIMDFLAKSGDTLNLDKCEDGCCKFEGTIDCHMLGGYVLNKIKEKME